MIVMQCPHCHGNTIVRFGKNTSGTPRFRCKSCLKTFVEQPQSRSLSLEKEEAIVRALAERTSQRGIARIFAVSRLTIRNLRKKTPTE